MHQLSSYTHDYCHQPHYLSRPHWLSSPPHWLYFHSPWSPPRDVVSPPAPHPRRRVWECAGWVDSGCRTWGRSEYTPTHCPPTPCPCAYTAFWLVASASPLCTSSIYKCIVILITTIWIWTITNNSQLRNMRWPQSSVRNPVTVLWRLFVCTSSIFIILKFTCENYNRKTMWSSVELQ